MDTLTLPTADGLRLHLRHWPTAAVAPRGTVLVVHGLGEHVGRYAHVAEALNGGGWHVSGFDQRGHGRSGGRQGVLAAPDSLLADLGAVVDAVRPRAPGPRVLVGHTTGARLMSSRETLGRTITSLKHDPIPGPEGLQRDLGAL